MYRIVEAERSEHERGTAADTKEHHEYALFISHDVSCRDLLHKAHVVPNGLYALKQYPLSGLGRLGTDKLRRSAFELLCTAIPRYKHRDGQICRRDAKRQRPVHSERKTGQIIYESIAEPYYSRKGKAPGRYSEYAAEYRRTAGIEHVFARDSAGGIAERLHDANLNALIVDHSGHRREADERRNEEEKHREHGCDALNDVSITFKAYIARVSVAVKDIRVGMIYVFYLLFGFIKLCRALIKLVLRRVKLCLT